MPGSSDEIQGLARAYGRGSQTYATVLDPTLGAIARDAVDLAGIAPGRRVLDLASGPGAIARVASGAGARVVAVDLSFGMMATARQRLPRADGCLVADAAAVPFRPRVFDAITCGLSLSHFTDLPAVGREVRRVLRAGGVFVGTSWGSESSDRSYAAVLSVYRKHLGGCPRPFSTLLDERTWSDSDRGREALERSGFGSTDVVTRTLEGRYATPAAALEWALAWPLTAGGLEGLEPVRREALCAEALAAVEATGDLHWWRSVHFYRAR